MTSGSARFRINWMELFGDPSSADRVVDVRFESPSLAPQAGDQEDECVDVDEHVIRKHNCGQLPANKHNSEGKSPSDDDDREQSARPAAKHKSKGKSPSDDDDHEQSAHPAAKHKSEGKSPSDDDDREQSARAAAKNDNKEAAATPEEIFEALRAIPGLDRDDLLRAYSKLIRDDRQFRSLMVLPKDTRKDWLLMEIDNQ